MPLSKNEKKVIIENIFGIPLMLCGFFFCAGWGRVFNFNFKNVRKFIQRNFLINILKVSWVWCYWLSCFHSTCCHEDPRPGEWGPAQPSPPPLPGEGQDCSVTECGEPGAQPTGTAALCGTLAPSLLRTLSGVFVLSCALPSGWTQSLGLLTCLLSKVTVSQGWVGSRPTGAERWDTVGQDTPSPFLESQRLSVKSFFFFFP